ncbi:hypothetical protein ElyMa_002077700 [Elysia marginata]|uniref:TCTP domain-containing protein n=1 Tax=Elysia marginata TaxID=1093978 RepID=A0AAV4FBJ1_9GAST|nr:hypothetical protein ElyMa_002077700 [Elysia marginata]
MCSGKTHIFDNYRDHKQTHVAVFVVEIEMKTRGQNTDNDVDDGGNDDDDDDDDDDDGGGGGGASAADDGDIQDCRVKDDVIDSCRY